MYYAETMRELQFQHHSIPLMNDIRKNIFMVMEYLKRGNEKIRAIQKKRSNRQILIKNKNLLLQWKMQTNK